MLIARRLFLALLHTDQPYMCLPYAATSAFHHAAIERVQGQVSAIEPAARNAASSMGAEIYFAVTSSLTEMPRALPTPSP